MTADSRTRSALRRPGYLLLLVVAASVAALVLGTGFFRSCLTREGARLATRAKLQALRLSMARISLLAAEDKVPFPQSPAEILDLLEKEQGGAVSRDLTNADNPLVDGWGTPMRFEGDIDAYEIRSAGSDRDFDTPDDLFLRGDTAGEHIGEGTDRPAWPKERFLDMDDAVAYQEPHGQFRILLPSGYTIIPTSVESRSLVVFSYAKDLRVTVAVEPSAGAWEPEGELTRRLETLRRGEDESYPGFDVTGYGRASIGNETGFFVDLEKDSVLVREIRVTGPSGPIVTVSLVTSGKDRRFILDALDRAVRTTMVIRP